MKHSIERPQGKLKLPFTYPKIEMEKKSSYNKEFTCEQLKKFILLFKKKVTFKQITKVDLFYSRLSFQKA